MFETDRLPKGWEQRINKMDYVSHFAARREKESARDFFFAAPDPD